MHFLICSFLIILYYINYCFCIIKVTGFIESRPIFNTPLNINDKKFFSISDDDFFNEFEELIRKSQEESATKSNNDTHLEAEESNFENLDSDIKKTYNISKYPEEESTVNYSYSLNKKPKTIRKLLKPSSTISSAKLAIPSEESVTTEGTREEDESIKPVYEPATDQDISSSYTWDIKPSDLKVKGAYFIKRYVQELREPFKRHPEDNSSPEFQIASLTGKIDYLVEHIKQAPKDNKAKRKILKLAYRRRKLLRVLHQTNKEILQKVLDTFNLEFDTLPYGLSRLSPEYIYRGRKTTKRDYSKEGGGKIIVTPATFDTITVESLVK